MIQRKKCLTQKDELLGTNTLERSGELGEGLRTVGYTYVDPEGNELKSKSPKVAVRKSPKTSGAFQVLHWEREGKKPKIFEVQFPNLPSHLTWPGAEDEEGAIEDLKHYVSLLAQAMTVVHA